MYNFKTNQTWQQREQKQNTSNLTKEEQTLNLLTCKTGRMKCEKKKKEKSGNSPVNLNVGQPLQTAQMCNSKDRCGFSFIMKSEESPSNSLKEEEHNMKFFCHNRKYISLIHSEYIFKLGKA